MRRAFGLLAFAALLPALVLAVTAPAAHADEATPPAAAPAPAATPAPAPAPAAAPVAPAQPPPAAAALVVGGCGTCCPTCDACLPRCARLTLEGHLSLLMDEPEGPPGGVSSGLPNAIDWDRLEYGLGFGGRVAYEWPALCSWTARIAGTFWGSWSDDGTETGTLGATPTPGGALNPSPTFAVPLSSEATLWDLEVSVWRPCTTAGTMCAAWGFGLRFASFEEESSFSFPLGVPVVGGPPGGQATLAADASNTLLAAQLMGRVGWCLCGGWDLTVDVAAFAGWRHTETEVATSGFTAPGLAGGTTEEDALGFGFAAEVALRYRVCPSWSLRGGYGLIALFDQARAYDLADLSRTASGSAGPRTSEEVVLGHRLFVGVEFNF